MLIVVTDIVGQVIQASIVAERFLPGFGYRFGISAVSFLRREIYIMLTDKMAGHWMQTHAQEVTDKHIEECASAYKHAHTDVEDYRDVPSADNFMYRSWKRVNESGA